MSAILDIENKYINTLSKVEESLVTALEHKLINTKPNYLLIKELDCWQGRADIVSAEITIINNLIDFRQAQALSQLTNARIISLLRPKSPRTLKYIFIKSGLSESTVKKSLRKLLNARMVNINNNGSYTLHDSFSIPKIVFNSYEAKLHNWKRALYQAIQYLGFSHYTWVVMPERYIKGAIENKYFFEANGVGLIGINEFGEKNVHFRAKKNQPRSKAFHLVGVGKALMEALH